MRRFVRILSLLVFVLCAGVLSTYVYIKLQITGSTLNAAEAEELLGNLKFVEFRFKSGVSSDRARMAADILRNRDKFVGLSFRELKQRFGHPTGYFWNDQFPAYILNENADVGAPVWQLVFMPGRRDTVRDVMINQNNFAPK